MVNSPKYFKEYQEKVGLPLDKELSSSEAQEIIDKHLVGYYKGRLTVRKGATYSVRDIVEQLAKLDAHIDASVKKGLRDSK